MASQAHTGALNTRWNQATWRPLLTPQAPPHTGCTGLLPILRHSWACMSLCLEILFLMAHSLFLSVQMVGPWPSLFQLGSFLKPTIHFWLHSVYGSPPFGCKLHGRGHFSLIFLVGWVGFASAYQVSRIMPWTLWLSTNISWVNEWVGTHWRFLFDVEGRFTLRVSAYLQSRQAMRTEGKPGRRLKGLHSTPCLIRSPGEWPTFRKTRMKTEHFDRVLDSI